MKKVVLKLMFADEKIKQKAMEKVSGFSGVESIAMDSNDKKLTVTGDIDPVCVVGKLRKLCQVEIVSVGPAKEPEKEKPKEKSDDKDKDYMAEYLKAYEEYCKKQQLYYNLVQPFQPTYYATTVEENPNGCVIC